MSWFSKIQNVRTQKIISTDDLTVECADNKTPVLSKVVYDDQQVSIGRVRVGGSAPTWTAYKGGEVLAFNKAQDNKITFDIQLTHRYKVGTALDFHVHVVPSDDTAGDVRWVLTVSGIDIGSDFPSETTYNATQTVALNSADQHIIFQIDANIGSSSAVSSIWLCSLTRTGTHLDDDYDNDIYLVGLDSHIQLDTQGSRQITTK